jgi:hypothetical protein
VRIDTNLTTLWCGSLKFFICISDNMQRFSRMWHRTRCGRPKAQTDLKKLTDEMASEVQKVNNAESCNSVMQSEPEALDQKAKIQQQEPEQNLKELKNVQFSFQKEHFSVLRRHHPALLVKRLSQLWRFSCCL